MASDCPNPTTYCKVANCATTGGTCAPKAALTDAATAVCGCNNISYWNESYAAHDGVNVTSLGASCPKLTATACNTANVKCPGGFYCDLGVAGGSALCSAIVTGTCWRLPANCPTTPGKFSVCGGSSNADCFNACTTIKDENPFYVDSRCP